MKILSTKLNLFDRNEKSNVNYYLNNNYHLFDYKCARYRFFDNTNFFKKISESIIKKLEQYQQQIGISVRTVFVCSLDRNSKLIKIDDEYVLILDLHQIFEYIEAIYLTQITNANGLNDYISIQKMIKEIFSLDNLKDDFQEEILNDFLYKHIDSHIDSDICAPIFLNNLADIFFNYGYVDASIICLNSILNINKKIYLNEFNNSLLINSEAFKTILCDTIISFIASHEINHLMVKVDGGKFIEDNFVETLVTIDLISRFNKFTEIWKEYVSHIKHVIEIRQDELYRIIESCKIDGELQTTLKKELNNLFHIWINMSFEEYSPHDNEELFCDIEAIKNIASTTDSINDINFEISNIVYMLMAQETYNIQKSITNIILRKTCNFTFINIKRIQFIICNLIFAKIYKHLPTNFQFYCILKDLTLSDTQFDDLIAEIMGQLGVMFNDYYIAAIYNSISFFKNDIIHKEINAVYFRDSKRTTFTFTDNVNNNKIKHDCRISPIDFIVMQENFIDAYLKYRRYVYENNIE